MINWLKSLFCPSEEEKQLIESLKKLYREYDVRIGPRGGISKTSKPEFVEKHRKELADVFPEIKAEIKRKGYCRIKG